MVFSLLFGGFSVPLRAKAQAEDTALSASGSFANFLDNKKTKSTDDSSVKESAIVNISSDNALVPAATGHVSSVNGADTIDSSSDQVNVYVVRKGDTIAQIADMFNVSINTVLMANDIKKGDSLTEGQVLIILPVSGLEITIAKGQTLKSIAKQYKVDIGDISQYNGITDSTKLAIGDTLIIPGGDMTDEGGDKPAANLGTTTANDKNYYVSHPIQNLIGYFINPLPTGHKTQGLHDGGRAVDIGAPTGTPIYAAASGTVIFAKSGTKSRYSNGGFGGLVILRHPNGTETYYAHQSKLATSAGQDVEQGQIIGYVGSTGHSTGPHLHFEVHGARNPGADGSWATNGSSNTLASNN